MPIESFAKEGCEGGVYCYSTCMVNTGTSAIVLCTVWTSSMYACMVAAYYGDSIRSSVYLDCVDKVLTLGCIFAPLCRTYNVRDSLQYGTD